MNSTPFYEDEPLTQIEFAQLVKKSLQEIAKKIMISAIKI
jgi:hypothetical protein